MENLAKIIVKWSGKEYEITLTENDTVADLKQAIEKATAVRPDRQKLLNLKLKGTLHFFNVAQQHFRVVFLRENA